LKKTGRKPAAWAPKPIPTRTDLAPTEWAWGENSSCELSPSNPCCSNYS